MGGHGRPANEGEFMGVSLSLHVPLLGWTIVENAVDQGLMRRGPAW